MEWSVAKIGSEMFDALHAYWTSPHEMSHIWEEILPHPLNYKQNKIRLEPPPA